MGAWNVIGDDAGAIGKKIVSSFSSELSTLSKDGIVQEASCSNTSFETEHRSILFSRSWINPTTRNIVCETCQLRIVGSLSKQYSAAFGFCSPAGMQ